MKDLTKIDRLNKSCNLILTQAQGYLKGAINADHSFEVSVSGAESADCYMSIADQKAPTILYFHDPSAVIPSELAIMADEYRKQSLNFILTEYCAAPSDTAPLTYSKLLECGQQIAKEVKAALIASDLQGPLFVMGHSVGSSVALDAALYNGEIIKGLFLESPIAETVPFFQACEVPEEDLDITEEDGFNSLVRIAEYKSPTLFFHGAKDDLVSIPQAEKLQSHSGARSKQFFIIPGAERNSLQKTGGQLYYETVKKFVDTVCGTNTWRERRRKFKSGKK